MRGGTELKYELGDFVEISKRWQKQDYPVYFETEEDFFDYCEKNNFDEGIPITIMRKINHSEKGFICGKRNGIKTSHMLDWSEGVDVGIGIAGRGFHIYGQEYEDVYLVATRMNCIYRVSKEDIRLIKDNSEFI